MIIDDLNFVGVAVPPYETDAPLIVDANTMLPFAIALQCLEAVAGRYAQILKAFCAMQIKQFTPGNPFNRSESRHGKIAKQRLGISAPEGSYSKVLHVYTSRDKKR